MSKYEFSTAQVDSEQEMRRDSYRLRRPHATRRRSRGQVRGEKSSLPGGIHKRRNKHWSW